jgi:aminoglycoside/choline kinase family phosphotransferase
MTLDKRLNQLNHWLSQQLPPDPFTLEPASSDASFRRYFRVSQSGNSYIVMDAPPEQEDTAPFITIAEHLTAQGTPVPFIHAKDTQQGFLLLSDLGNQPYLDILEPHTATALYQTAIDALIQMQTADHSQLQLSNYDAALLQQEMDLFPNWFLGTHLDITPPDFLADTFKILTDNALAQPTVFVHRDYHSRNLMHTPDEKLGIIDFQDAVMGPISYDLVSLLRDSYIAWSDAEIANWVSYYWQQAVSTGLLKKVSLEQFTRWFDLMGLQRQLKILGIFCRLYYRDGKSNYLNDLPQTLKYVQQVSARYPELTALHTLVTTNEKIASIVK